MSYATIADARAEGVTTDAASLFVSSDDLTFTLDIEVIDQPKSSFNGIINGPGAARKPAAPISAINATEATHQAG